MSKIDVISTLESLEKRSASTFYMIFSLDPGYFRSRKALIVVRRD